VSSEPTVVAVLLWAGADNRGMDVLVGVDNSDRGMETLEEAVEQAQQAGEDLTVAVYTYGDESISEAETSVRDWLANLGVEASIERIEGDPGSQLVELAEEGEYDRIVLSGGTVSPLGKINLTPIHEFVLLNARTTVTLVR